ncbi:hypothetical protein [Propionispora vibrioides]|uniref:hypothetical protein n=1 Tax=Propionispora vibrioides TaxID=112903 RepID=UPI0015A6E51F|nr:hypothetical protein [Propionispora vibrioides]
MSQIDFGFTKFFGRIILVVFIGLVALTGGICIFDSQGIQRRENGLISEFQAITHPKETQQLDFNLRHKIVRRWIDAEYRYKLSSTELESYYDQELLKKGWIKEPINEKGDEQFRYFKYKKGDYEIIFRPYKDIWIIQVYLRDFYDKLG